MIELTVDDPVALEVLPAGARCHHPGAYRIS